jgi:hypothetical protein
LHGVVGVLHRPEDPVAMRVELGAVHLHKLPVRTIATGTGTLEPSRLPKIRVITTHRRNARATTPTSTTREKSEMPPPFPPSGRVSVMSVQPTACADEIGVDQQGEPT